MGGYLKVATAAIIWGSIGIIVRIIDVPVLVLTFYRVLFASIAIFAYLLFTKKLKALYVGKDIYRIVVMGILLAINWAAFFFSVKTTTIANAVLLTYTAPILVAILAPIFLREKLERITIITLLISMLGAIFITSPSFGINNSKETIGFFWAAISAVTYAIVVILSKPLTAYQNVLAIIFYEEITCTVVLSPSLIFYKAHIDFSTLMLLVVLGCIHTALAAGLYLSGLKNIKAQHVGVFTYLDPLSAVIFAAIFLNETPGLTTLIGGLLIVLSGIVLVSASKKRVETEIVAE